VRTKWTRQLSWGSQSFGNDPRSFICTKKLWTRPGDEILDLVARLLRCPIASILPTCRPDLSTSRRPLSYISWYLKTGDVCPSRGSSVVAIDAPQALMNCKSITLCILLISQPAANASSKDEHVIVVSCQPHGHRSR
jgi:hypothetical protein